MNNQLAHNSAHPLLLVELPIIDLATRQELTKAINRYVEIGFLCYVLNDSSSQIAEGVSPSLLNDASRDYIKDYPAIKGAYVNLSDDFYTQDVDKFKYSHKSTFTPPNSGLITLIEIELLSKGVSINLKRSQMVYKTKPFSDMAISVEMGYIHYKQFLKSHRITINTLNSN